MKGYCFLQCQKYMFFARKHKKNDLVRFRNKIILVKILYICYHYNGAIV